MIELRTEYRFSSQIWLILLGFGLFGLDLAHFSWIKAILLGFGPYSLDLGPKGDEALRVGQGGGRTDVRTDRFPLCSTGLRPLQGRCPKTRITLAFFNRLGRNMVCIL